MTEPNAPTPPPAQPGGPADISSLGRTGQGDARDLTQIRPLGFFPADYATVENNKVYVSGGFWSQLRFGAFPATLPMCSLVAVLKVPWHANNHDHEFLLAIEDSDGRRHDFAIGGSFRGSPGPEMSYGDPGEVPLAVPIYGLTFDRPGGYSFVLEVDSEEVGRYPFKVMQVVMPGFQYAQSPPQA